MNAKRSHCPNPAIITLLKEAAESPSLALKDVFVMSEDIQSASSSSGEGQNREVTLSIEHQVRVSTQQEATIYYMHPNKREYHYICPPTHTHTSAVCSGPPKKLECYH